MRSILAKCHNQPYRIVFAMASASSLVLANDVLANPEGGAVAAGAATITQTSASRTDIQQSSDKAVINWTSFSIGENEETHFQQPNSRSITLNRVLGSDPSSIFGRLTANGQVWLVNQNGIVFGPSAQVDVAGLLATTIDISDADFLAGSYRFDRLSNPDSTITNAGRITVADTGLAALVAPGVENAGTISARLGYVALASGAGFTVDLYGDGKFNLKLTRELQSPPHDPQGQPLDARVRNSGALIADGGTVLMSAAAASDVVRSVVNMDGYIQARSIGVDRGDVVLSAGEGVALVSGAIDASGKNYGELGGHITVAGNGVALLSGSKIDASGDRGGGTVLIGGDYMGGHGDPTVIAQYGIQLEEKPVLSAKRTLVAPSASINANAISSGDGGKVVVWADETTAFGGSILARGGAQGGDGGFVEVSGKRQLFYQGLVDTLAPFGEVGTLLLDPVFLNIDDSQPEQNFLTSLSFGTTLFSPVSASSGQTSLTSTISTARILNALQTSNVRLLAFADFFAGNPTININSPLIIPATNTRNLEITVGQFGTINVNAPIDFSGSNNELWFSSPFVGSTLNINAPITLRQTFAGDSTHIWIQVTNVVIDDELKVVSPFSASASGGFAIRFDSNRDGDTIAINSTIDLSQSQRGILFNDVATITSGSNGSIKLGPSNFINFVANVGVTSAAPTIGSSSQALTITVANDTDTPTILSTSFTNGLGQAVATREFVRTPVFANSASLTGANSVYLEYVGYGSTPFDATTFLRFVFDVQDGAAGGVKNVGQIEGEWGLLLEDLLPPDSSYDFWNEFQRLMRVWRDEEATRLLAQGIESAPAPSPAVRPSARVVADFLWGLALDVVVAVANTPGKILKGTYDIVSFGVFAVDIATDAVLSPGWKAKLLLYESAKTAQSLFLDIVPISKQLEKAYTAARVGKVLAEAPIIFAVDQVLDENVLQEGSVQRYKYENARKRSKFLEP